jgi:hypothetical protein
MRHSQGSIEVFLCVGARRAYSFIQVRGVGGAEYDLLLTYADVC